MGWRGQKAGEGREGAKEGWLFDPQAAACAFPVLLTLGRCAISHQYNLKSTGSRPGKQVDGEEAYHGARSDFRIMNKKRSEVQHSNLSLPSPRPPRCARPPDLTLLIVMVGSSFLSFGMHARHPSLGPSAISWLEQDSLVLGGALFSSMKQCANWRAVTVVE